MLCTAGATPVSDGWLAVIIFMYPLIVLGVSPSIQLTVPISVPVVSSKYIKVFCASLKFSVCSSPAFSPHFRNMLFTSVL